MAGWGSAGRRARHVLGAGRGVMERAVAERPAVGVRTPRAPPNTLDCRPRARGRWLAGIGGGVGEG